MVHEYSLSGTPPMMTHIFENDLGKRIIATKGAPEAIMQSSNLDPSRQHQIHEAMQTLTSEGYRVLAVGEAHSFHNNYPATQQEFQFDFKGLIAFYDPPKHRRYFYYHRHASLCSSLNPVLCF